ncbi:MAG: 2-amino-4-hydroxy-6-hydroxymethyldihydropteridine diphosphokinase [Ignavibacteriaceae bacterium]
MNNIVYIGIGSNVGVQINNIDFAVELINENPYCEVVSVSSIYETTPYGEIVQNDFFNAVIKIRTFFEPKDLFYLLKSIENQVGRKVVTKWGPREIDLDILLYNNLIYSDEEITIPHKDMLNRDFVMVPLIEIAPELIHPELHKKISEISIFQPETSESLFHGNKTYIIRKIPHKVLIQ